MINNEPVTISSTFRNSAGVSLRHNKREFIAANVDPSRTENNVFLKPYEELSDVYHKLFDEALEKYNAKQRSISKPGRQIPDYLEKIENESSKKNGRKPFYEAVFQIGKAENFGIADWSENAELAKQILTEFYDSFAERNPNLYVFGAVLHMDETTPHMHIDFVPVVYGCKQSLETQTSLSKAMIQQGIPAAESRTFTERSGWFQSERAALEKIANAHGLEIDHLESEPRATLAVEDYKRKRMQADRNAAKAERDQALQETAALQETCRKQQAALQQAEEKAEAAEARAVAADKKAEAAEVRAVAADKKAEAAEVRAVAADKKAVLAEEQAEKAEEAKAEADREEKRAEALKEKVEKAEKDAEALKEEVEKAEKDAETLENNLQKLLDSSARAAAEAVYDSLETETAGRIKAGIQGKIYSFIDWLTGQEGEDALDKAYPAAFQKKRTQNILGWFAERVEKRLLNSINRLFSRKEYRADSTIREFEIGEAVAAAKKQIKLEYQKIGERKVPVRAAPVWQPPAPQPEKETPGPEEQPRQQEVKKKKNRGMER